MARAVTGTAQVLLRFLPISVAPRLHMPYLFGIDANLPYLAKHTDATIQAFLRIAAAWLFGMPMDRDESKSRASLGVIYLMRVLGDVRLAFEDRYCFL